MGLKIQQDNSIQIEVEIEVNQPIDKITIMIMKKKIIKMKLIRKINNI